MVAALGLAPNSTAQVADSWVFDKRRSQVYDGIDINIYTYRLEKVCVKVC